MSEPVALELALYDQVFAHAQDEYPREACGLLVHSHADKLLYRRCRNIAPAESARDRFHIHPEDWCFAEEEGAVLAIVHSHPDASAEPSDADRAGCYASGLAWYVIAVPGGTMRKIEPAPLPLVGREFAHGVVDCYSLVRDYYAQTLAIELPDFARDDGWWERGQDLYRENFAAAGFVDLGLPRGLEGGAAEIRKHDGLLMQVAARKENHAAVFVGPVNGVDCILHHLYGRLSGHEPWGGYWLRHCTGVLRHRSLL